MNKTALYIVATPIGNLGDISYRAVETLKQVDLIAAEDTRHSKKLLEYFDIKTPMIALHEHNETQQYANVLHLLHSGQSIALISDAGTPLINDPGYRLVHEARKENILVVPIPGSCAAIAALSASGLPSDRFIFEGFLPAKQHGRVERLQQLQNETRTMIFYESPHRVLKSLQDMLDVFGDERIAVIARELTKLHETMYENTFSNLITWFQKNTDQQRGEFVILVQGLSKQETKEIAEKDLQVLNVLLEELSVKQATALTAKITGKKKNALYDVALKNQGK